MEQTFYGKVTLLSQEELVNVPGQRILRLMLDAPEIASKARPGQFVNLYTEDKALLLPRPISICDADAEKGTLTLVYAVVGKGTDWLSALTAGDEVRAAGPLGNGFPLEEALSVAVSEIYLVGGGLGVPPMLFAAKELYKRAGSRPIRIFNGFRSTPWLEEKFLPYGEVMSASDDGASGFQGTVIDAMEYARVMADDLHHGVLFACGPLPMLRALQNWQTAYNLDSWFSLEERMGCGYGACAGCPVNLRGEDGEPVHRKVCKDGPVFYGEDVMFP